MERLLWHLSRELAERVEVRLVAPRGSKGHAPPAVAVREIPLVPLWRFLASALLKGLSERRGWKPHIVFAGSGLVAPMAWLSARASGARAAVYLHGLDVIVDHPLYQLLWLPFFRRMDQVVVNSSATRGLAEGIGIPSERISIVPPGVVLSGPIGEAERQRIRQEFRRVHGVGEGPMLLSVGRLTPRKGLLEFVRDVLPRIVRVRPDVKLVIIGAPPGQALAARSLTPERIREAAREAGIGGQLHFLGEVSDQVLDSAYRAADLHVFPVREIPGDPEGFGMVAVEAAAHGLPTVAYATGGVVDAVADGISGRLVTPGDCEGFAAATLEFLTRPLPAGPMLDFAAGFSWHKVGERFAAILGLKVTESASGAR